MSNKKITRKNFGRKEDNLPSMDLISVQKESWNWFLTEGIAQEVAQISPIDDFTGKNWQLILGEHSLEEPIITPLQATEKGLTYAAPFKINTILVNKTTGEQIEQEVFFGNIPQMTEAGTFIINGIERTIINQLVRSPGVYFSAEQDKATARMLYKSEIRPLHGSWLEFEVGKKDIIWARIDKRRKLPATVLLRAMGYEADKQILSLFEEVDTDKDHQYIKKTIEKDQTRNREDALLEIYRKLRPGEPALIDNAENLFNNAFLDNRRYDLGRVGRHKINKRLNLSVANERNNWVLTKEDVLGAISYLIGLQNGTGRTDDIDHLGNRRLRRVGELVATHAFRIGLLRLERSIKEKMSLISSDERPNPQNLINARQLISSINEFFRSSQLSQILDDTNPLSQLDHLRRVSVLGPGGISRERAAFSIRDINSSQYGRIDPVRSPEGPNIGLVTYLALYARVNEFGFIETPYRKVEKVKAGNKTKIKVTDEIIYMTADDEEEYHITESTVNIDEKGFITDDRVPFRYKGQFIEGSVENVDYIDTTPRQVFGASASLIPFLPNDDGNRALMGSNMQCQAVPLINPNSPVVGTGMEHEVASAMGLVIKSDYSGVIDYVDANKIVIKLDTKTTDKSHGDIEILDSGKRVEYKITKFKRTAQSTSYNQKVVVKVGDKVSKGDLLADGPSSQDGELALGQNMVVAYAPIDGYGFEDALLVSDRLVREDALTSIHIKEYSADVVETKLGPEELTPDIPNVNESELSHLGTDGIIVIGSEVGPNDILVGKIAPKGETELTAEERLLRAIFGEKAREVRDTSLRVPHGEAGVVVDIQILDKEKGDELSPGVLKTVVVKVAQLRKVMVGDKLAGRHGNKGVIAKILPAADMPYMEDGTPVDIIISPLSVLARMNLGQLLEAGLGLALNKQSTKGAVPVFDKIPEAVVAEELKKAGLNPTGKTKLYDGRTGEPFVEDTVVGVGYILKLKHMIEDKTHARSTGPYSLVTQQPLGGKAQMGGQRLGEMEVWALEAHRAAHILQEMLTIKSDDIVGRSQAFGAIVKGETIPEARVPESFKVLIRELNSLGLAINVQGSYRDDVSEDKKNATDPLLQIKSLDDIDSLQIKLASPEDIREWSRGEITKPETINYRTLKPEKDGLFDERIFGPSKDWECYCGKYKRIRYKGVVCDKCGVEVTESRVRRERMGHISLAAPVAHVWYFKGAPSRISLLLDLPPKAIEQVVYFARYMVMSVNDEGRKDAVKVLVKAQSDKEVEIKNIYKDRKTLLHTDFEARKEKTKDRVKDKDQLSLAISEIELEERKRTTALAEEERETLAKTKELFDKLIALVKNLKQFGFLTEEEYDQLDAYSVSDFLTVKMGADAVLEALKSFNIDEEAKKVREEINSLKSKGSRYVKLTKRIKLIEGMRNAKVNPSWMIMSVLPVLPPDLRPMVQLSGGRFATSDLNDLYRRVINRNNRLKHLINLGAPEIILRNEKRMLQESVDSLVDASQRKATRRGRGKQPLRSLSDMLRGKQGRFRANLLGKRVDYSGRSVIVVGPELKLNQCGLPKDMALEIAKPFVLHEMIARGIAPNVKSAKNIIERKPAEVFDILEEITREHPVLLNRAPTLHKLGIQAFYPVLIEGNAIRLHPAVCKGFNADFDGDQMAVHLPLSKNSIEEAKRLMMSDQNMLQPSNGTPMAAPASKEIALGIYYITTVDERIAESQTVFADEKEAMKAYSLGIISLRQKIKVRLDKNNNILETTVGRLMFNARLPKEFDYINENVSSDVVKDLTDRAVKHLPHEKAIKLIDDMKEIGFIGGTISGISFAVSDANIHPDKAKVMAEADQRVAEIEQNYTLGLITAEEKKRLSLDIWLETTEKLSDMTWEVLDPYSSIKIVVDAKAGRTSKNQIKQLSAMRGLSYDPMGRIVELPSKSNFREGLSIFEYVTAARGARKGLTDTALKTADAGYLTRRLVDVSHDSIVRDEDCGTQEFVTIKKSERTKSFSNRILGRTAANDIKSNDGAVLVAGGMIIDEEMAKKIAGEESIETVDIYSPLTCSSRKGVCQKCYGWDLGTKEVVRFGTPVGVLAAQSIGEPGTQLTMRTKHTGGVVGVDVTQGLPRVEELFEARTPKSLSPLSEIGGKVKIKDEEDGIHVSVVNNSVKPAEEREYLVDKTAKLMVDDGQLIEAGTQLASGSMDVKELLIVKGMRSAQEYMVNELQKVYESQGISISDRHFEVIVRKMTDEVKVTNAGDTSLLPGEQVDISTFEKENEKVIAAGGTAATAKQIILGISRRALYTKSWLSAASFQQTTDILTESALTGRKDELEGLKENVIIGRLIPVKVDEITTPLEEVTEVNTVTA